MSDRLPDMSSSHTPAPIKPCDVFSEEIHLLVDRELGPAESAVVEEHLTGCARCQALAMHLERMASVLKAWDAQANDVEAPALRLKHGVLARVAEQSARRRRDDVTVRVIHYATAAMVVLGLGLGLFLGLTDRAAPIAAPKIYVSDAPMPLAARVPEAVVFNAGGPVVPYEPEDILAGIQRPTFAELEAPERARRAPQLDRAVWAVQSDDGVPALVERFKRMEDLEDCLGVRVVFWNGPAADKSDERPGDPLVTERALSWLSEQGYLKRWMQRATPRSPTVATDPAPVVASRSTKVTARQMLQPMPGIDRELRSKQMRQPFIRTYAPKKPGGAAMAAKRASERVHLLDGWALLREKSGLKSGFDPSRVRFMDPVAANANGRIHFAPSGQGANTVVVIVKNTSLPIYIPAGQFLSGGIADRVIAHPVWLPATRGEKPYIVHCRSVQKFEHGNASEPLVLQPEIAGPTIRALLAAGASPRKVKVAAGRVLAAVNGERGTLLGNWSLYHIHRGMQARMMKTIRSVNWDGMQGFIATDAQGRFVGSEVVRPSGHAATELLRRLWVSYSLEAVHRVMAARRGVVAQEQFAAPSDGLAQVLRRLGSHGGEFQTPKGIEQPEGARVSQLEVVAAGVHMHALEVAGVPSIVSSLSSAP